MNFCVEIDPELEIEASKTSFFDRSKPVYELQLSHILISRLIWQNQFYITHLINRYDTSMIYNFDTWVWNKQFSLRV